NPVRRICDRPVGERDQETSHDWSQLPQQETEDRRSDAENTPESFTTVQPVRSLSVSDSVGHSAERKSKSCRGTRALDEERLAGQLSSQNSWKTGDLLYSA